MFEEEDDDSYRQYVEQLESLEQQYYEQLHQSGVQNERTNPTPR